MRLKILLIDIDGLRPDVFSSALGDGAIPNLARIVGGSHFSTGIQIPALAPAPSITFTSQASLFTGAHPSQHGIPGNQFFNRFGTCSEGFPRHYAFDVGDTLEVDDAVQVFTKGLASNCLQVPTVYDRFSDWGWRSAVVGNMYASGADIWLKPSLVDIARYTKGGNLFGLESEQYDRRILQKSVDFVSANGFPEVMSVYFLGVDHESHHHGPGAQRDFLINSIDPMIGELWDLVLSSKPDPLPLVAIFSDHGQIQVIPDDVHSLKLGFPFEREMAHLFDALGLDVHDKPGEGPNCDAVVALNGGLAQVYLRHRQRQWSDLPLFDRDVYLVGRAFWDAHKTGQFAPELHGALAGVLIRNVEADGWYAPYYSLTPTGEIITLEQWFSTSYSSDQSSDPQEYIDPVNRLNNLNSPLTGDLILISNYASYYYFGAPLSGVHGGLHPEESAVTLVYGFPGVQSRVADQMKDAVQKSIQERCLAEGVRHPSTADLLTGLLAVVES